MSMGATPGDEGDACPRNIFPGVYPFEILSVFDLRALLCGQDRQKRRILGLVLRPKTFGGWTTRTI